MVLTLVYIILTKKHVENVTDLDDSGSNAGHNAVGEIIKNDVPNYV